MKPVGVDEFLARYWHLLKKLFEMSLRDSVPNGYNGLSELVVTPETVMIVQSRNAQNSEGLTRQGCGQGYVNRAVCNNTTSVEPILFQPRP
jgi:hypothetical protein